MNRHKNEEVFIFTGAREHIVRGRFDPVETIAYSAKRLRLRKGEKDPVSF
jgi:hypothetical protein